MLLPPHSAADASHPVDIGPRQLDVIRQLLFDRRGFRLDGYKDSCVRRRISIRIRATHTDTAEQYCSRLADSDDELDRLLKVLTVHVSQFYRNPPTFERLKRDVLPALLQQRTQNGAAGFRGWSVGCAGGEEPYSLAMVLHGLMTGGADPAVELLATDIDPAVLAVARQGIYGDERLAELPASLRDTWFTPFEGRYLLSREIIGMVTFRQEDIFATDFYEPCDLILCRNVLIYFERDQQVRIIRNFARVLRPGGVLVLGKSETLFGECRRWFHTICPQERIYRVQTRFNDQG